MALGHEPRPLLAGSAALSRVLAAVALAAGLLAGCAPDDGADGDGVVYVTSGFTDQLLLLDAADGALLDSISLDRRPDEVDEPHGIAISPDGRHLYVTVSHGAPTLWKFELPETRLVGRLELPAAGAARIGITPDGERAFIPDYHRAGLGEPSRVSVVDLHDLEMLADPVVCPAPHDARVSPRGGEVAFTCSLSDEVVILDTATLDERARFRVGADPGPPGEPRFRPLNLVWLPDGESLLVTLHESAGIGHYSRDGRTLGRVDVGSGPAQLEITADGRTAVVANRREGTVSVVDVESLTERARVPLAGAHPHGVALDADGSTAFVTYEGEVEGMGGVAAVALEQAEVLWAVDAGVYTLGVVHRP